MKKLGLAMAAVLALLSIAAPFLRLDRLLDCAQDAPPGVSFGRG